MKMLSNIEAIIHSMTPKEVSRSIDVKKAQIRKVLEQNRASQSIDETV
jgi:signal recognition particle GTPase